MSSPINVFLAYARDDEQLLRELEQHLSVLKQEKIIEIWHEQKVSPGAEWDQEIAKHLNNAQIILLLISAAFLSSDYCYSVEMQRVLKRHERGEVRVIPIILRPIYWQTSPFGKLQALPKFSRAITGSMWTSRDEAFSEVVEGIHKAVEEFLALSHDQTRKMGLSTREEAQDASPARRTFLSKSIVCTCPSCIEEFYPGDCDIVSLTTGEILEPAPVRWLDKQIVRRNPKSLSTPAYLSKSACRVCPWCEYHLPYNIETVENITIAVIGNPNSGKSHYITSLLHQMQERWIKENSRYIQIKPVDRKQHPIESEFDYVFRNGGALPPTQRGLRHLMPLIYELTFQSSSVHHRKTINLILYDVSGEDYKNADSRVDFAKHIFHANGIIFLVDSHLLNYVHKRIPIHLKFFMRDQYKIAMPEEDLLESLWQIFRRIHDKDVNKYLRSIPVAITLSKSDLLKYTAPIAPAYRLLSNPIYSSRANLPDLEKVEKEVKRILEESAEHTLLDTIQMFPLTKFLATSATGCPRDATTDLYPYIDPCRCLDPLLWIFHMLGIIE